MSTEFYASAMGGPEPRVLARFVTDEHGLHVERLDRRDGRWVVDSSVAGFVTGHDDWAKRISEDEAAKLVASWRLDPSVLNAPVIEPAPST